MKNNDLIQALTDDGVNVLNAFAPDDSYSLPDEQWITSVFGTAFKSFLSDIGDSIWVAEINDCDDFARAATFYAHLLHRNSSRGTPREVTALAFGDFGYERDIGGAHCINVIVTKDRVLYFEPQNQQLVTLSDNEKASCEFVRF